MEKKNWDCKDCGIFRWVIDRPATDKEIKDLKEDYCIDDDFVLDNPTTKEGWAKSELYNGENVWELSEILEYSISDFCCDCQLKLKKYKIFE